MDFQEIITRNEDKTKLLFGLQPNPHAGGRYGVIYVDRMQFGYLFVQYSEVWRFATLHSGQVSGFSEHLEELLESRILSLEPERRVARLEELAHLGYLYYGAEKVLSSPDVDIIINQSLKTILDEIEWQVDQIDEIHLLGAPGLVRAVARYSELSRHKSLRKSPNDLPENDLDELVKRGDKHIQANPELAYVVSPATFSIALLTLKAGVLKVVLEPIFKKGESLLEFSKRRQRLVVFPCQEKQNVIEVHLFDGEDVDPEKQIPIRSFRAEGRNLRRLILEFYFDKEAIPIVECTDSSVKWTPTPKKLIQSPELKQIKGDLDLLIILDGTCETLLGEEGTGRNDLNELFDKLAGSLPEARVALFAFGDKELSHIAEPELKAKYVIRPENPEFIEAKDKTSLHALADEIEYTSGGDYEDSLELALQVANRMKWRRNAEKFILLLGDSPPPARYPPSFSLGGHISGIDYRKELEKLREARVSFYAVFAPVPADDFPYQKELQRKTVTIWRDEIADGGVFRMYDDFKVDELLEYLQERPKSEIRIEPEPLLPQLERIWITRRITSDFPRGFTER